MGGVEDLGSGGMETMLNSIATSAQLACLLEVAATPKPGNVHRLADFKDTRFEHFLASASAIHPQARGAAARGYRAGLGRLPFGEIRVGGYILDAVEATRRWQRGGNTNLGALSLIIPLSAGAGLALSTQKRAAPPTLRRNVWRVMEATTARDAVAFYQAVQRSGAGGLEGGEGLGDLDVTKPSSPSAVRRRGMSLSEVMRLCSKRDRVCGEWVTGMAVTFEVGYPTLKAAISGIGDINSAIIQTYLTILAQFPDSLITRRMGEETAKAVSTRAKNILEAGGMMEEGGRRKIIKMDKELRAQGNALNPGTTADLTASSIMVALLEGYRP